MVQTFKTIKQPPNILDFAPFETLFIRIKETFKIALFSQKIAWMASKWWMSPRARTLNYWSTPHNARFLWVISELNPLKLLKWQNWAVLGLKFPMWQWRLSKRDRISSFEHYLSYSQLIMNPFWCTHCTSKLLFPSCDLSLCCIIIWFWKITKYHGNWK